MPRIRTVTVTVVATLLALSLVATVALLGTGVASARHPDDAPDLSEHADFEVDFPHATDHYPGSMNEENGSVHYFASGADAFAEQDAEEGVWIDWIIVHAEYQGEDWIDYSACDVPNTAAFGIDRGNNNEGTNYDEDLVQKQKQANFLDNGITINFYDFEDFGNDPPYMAPEDAIVAAQGAGSSAGPCLTLTDEPGWYRIAAFLNGTVADNGPDEPPSADARQVSLELNSNNYLYVCECDSRAEAEEQLGPPPGPGPTTPTATPTPTEGGTPTATPAPTTQDPGGGGETPAPTTEPGGTEPTDRTPADTVQPTDTRAPDTRNRNVDGGDGVLTPTVDGGPGFGPVVALLALLGTTLLARRRS